MALAVDLFEHKTEEQQFEEWCRRQGFFSTADVLKYAVSDYYLRAKRTLNDFVREDKVRIIPKDECVFRGFKAKMAFYEYIKR